MNSKFYKSCAVPQCKSTTIKTPQKLFIHVPRSKDMRKKWLQLARRDPALICTHSKMYFCEDHFELPNDMENYTEYHLMGSVSQVRMKAGCLPKKFECQPDRKRRMNIHSPQPLAVKRQRLQTIQECLDEIEETHSTVLLQNICVADVLTSSSSDILQPLVEPIVTLTTDEYIHVSLHPKVRSKGTQTVTMHTNMALSPLKNLTTSSKSEVDRKSVPTLSGQVWSCRNCRQLCFNEQRYDSDEVLLLTPSATGSNVLPSLYSQQIKTSSENNIIHELSIKLEQE